MCINIQQAGGVRDVFGRSSHSCKLFQSETGPTFRVVPIEVASRWQRFGADIESLELDGWCHMNHNLCTSDSCM